MNKGVELTSQKAGLSNDISLILDIIDKANVNDGDTVIASFWNTPAVYNIIKTMYPHSKVYYVEDESLRDVFGVDTSDAIYFDMKGKEFPKFMEKDVVVISNPPYGRIGAEITKNIIDNVNFKQFINLMPANDYCRGNTDLYKYVDIDNMISYRDMFKDADVTTHLTAINKTPSDITKDEFQIRNYIDRSLDKYFFENKKRTHYAIDKFTTNTKLSVIKELNVESSIILGAKDANHKHFPFSKNNVQYKWNFDRSADYDFVVNNYSNGVSTSLYTIEFNTEEEKRNISKFMYSIDGFRFFSKIFTAVNVDSYIMPSKFLPKVDWTKEWTVEEILSDYNYTEEEIKEVINDLNNFRYMEIE